jgi:hypothetical protein
MYLTPLRRERMTKGEVERAKRRALTVLDKWLDVTGAIPVGNSWIDELESIVEDAVDIGARAALNINYKDTRNKEGGRTEVDGS